ncbi:hypothetical protein N9208_04515 [Akkermansiaceae bacterium]|nr:hypothetical protein [Akkermansiaceae bacterium]
MKPVIKALLITSFCLPFISCNKEEVNSLKEQNDKLQKQLDKLIAAQETKEEEGDKLQKQIDKLIAAQETKEEEEEKAAEESKEQTANLRDDILAIAKQMADKEYDCAGVFYSDYNLLKRNGYDDDLKQPSNDIARYVDLFKSTLASYPKAENPPSLVKFSELAQQWADYKKSFMEGVAVGSAGMAYKDSAKLQTAGEATVLEAKTNKANEEKEFLAGVEALFN